jgi:hypothetical protein
LRDSEISLPCPKDKDDSPDNNQIQKPKQKEKPVKAGRICGLEVWELEGNMKMEWQSLEPQIEDLVR